MSRDFYRFNNMAVEEALELAFPFADELPVGVTLTGTPTVTATRCGGGYEDPTPQDFVVDVSVAGSIVTVAVAGRFADVDYEIRATSTTSDPLLTLTRIGRIYVI